MYGPIFGFTENDALSFFDAFLTAIKNFFEWLGILVMPEDDATDAE